MKLIHSIELSLEETTTSYTIGCEGIHLISNEFLQWLRQRNLFPLFDFNYELENGKFILNIIRDVLSETDLVELKLRWG